VLSLSPSPLPPATPQGPASTRSKSPNPPPPQPPPPPTMPASTSLSTGGTFRRSTVSTRASTVYPEPRRSCRNSAISLLSTLFSVTVRLFPFSLSHPSPISFLLSPFFPPFPSSLRTLFPLFDADNASSQVPATPPPERPPPPSPARFRTPHSSKAPSPPPDLSRSSTPGNTSSVLSYLLRTLLLSLPACPALSFEEGSSAISREKG
jgi:hypothetical protein